MEREVVMAGIGGQGVQLATKILAHALNNEGRYVMHFAAFGGTVRGGDVECTVVTGTEPLSAPPIIPSAWMVIAMHSQPLPVVAPKVRRGGLFVANTPLVNDYSALATSGLDILEIPAASIAEELGNVQGAAMVLLGAVCAATGLASIEQLVKGLDILTPPYRKSTVPANARAFEAGAAYAHQHLHGTQPAWGRLAATS